MPNYEPYGSPATGSNYKPAQFDAGQRMAQGLPTPGSGAGAPLGYSSLYRGQPTIAGGMQPGNGTSVAAWHNNVTTPNFRSIGIQQGQRVAAQIRPNAYEQGILSRTPEGRQMLAQYQPQAAPAQPRPAVASTYAARPAVAPSSAPAAGAATPNLAALAARNASGSAALERFNPPGSSAPQVRGLPRYDAAKLAARAYGSPARRIGMQSPQNHVGMQPAGPGLSQYAQATYNYHRAANYGHDLSMAAAMEAEHGLQQQQSQQQLASSTARMQNAQADWANTRTSNYNPYAEMVTALVQGGMQTPQAHQMTRESGVFPPQRRPAGTFPGTPYSYNPGQPQQPTADPNEIHNPEFSRLRDLMSQDIPAGEMAQKAASLGVPGYDNTSTPQGKALLGEMEKRYGDSPPSAPDILGELAASRGGPVGSLINLLTGNWGDGAIFDPAGAAQRQHSAASLWSKLHGGQSSAPMLRSIPSPVPPIDESAISRFFNLNNSGQGYLLNAYLRGIPSPESDPNAAVPGPGYRPPF